MLGYQNTATNRAAGPNAMLLHLPARRLDPRHFVPAGSHAGVLPSMLDAVRPLPVDSGIDWMGWKPDEVEVFERLPGGARRRSDADHRRAVRVPRHKRPRVDPALLAFYREALPGHAFTLCCFDNARAEGAKPATDSATTSRIATTRSQPAAWARPPVPAAHGGSRARTGPKSFDLRRHVGERRFDRLSFRDPRGRDPDAAQARSIIRRSHGLAVYAS
ncbi:hypothetical protein AB0J86_05475 [Micromonospora sp. NPDC049559]|uniref:hypothetical protein n=1 Tax=Micromonospora sp. NPDC049559 TaxID=3155923 RepID=UPI003447F662